MEGQGCCEIRQEDLMAVEVCVIWRVVCRGVALLQFRYHVSTGGRMVGALEAFGDKVVVGSAATMHGLVRVNFSYRL